jgi:hypothetical protein
MHVLCPDCGKTWNLACPECAHDKAAWHTRETGHDRVRVSGVDDTKGRPPDLIAASLPAWIKELIIGY